MNIIGKSLIYKSLIIFVVPLLMLWSCGGSKNNEESIIDKIDNLEGAGSSLIKIDNHVFSVPSPYQIAILINQLEFDYNKDIINPYNKSHSYISNFKKALNLGVYGANLGYLTMYEQSSESVQYFSVIKILMQELNIESSFGKDLFKRIETNIGNRDSLMHLVSYSYRDIDQYLKDNNRNDIGSLIITGGWVESLYFMTILSKEKQSEELFTRIGEQKYPLDNLIKILSPYYNVSSEYSNLIDALIDLAYEFDGVDIKYSYQPPVVDADNKLTTINSKSELTMSDLQLKTISEKIAEIRKLIVD